MRSNIIKVFMSFCLAAGLFISCHQLETENNTIQNHKDDKTVFISSENSEIVLGEKFENLFTVEAAQARSVTDEVIEANYYYFRCRSSDNEKIKWLSDTYGFLSIVPLDREILEGGTVYKDPDLKEGEAPWYYLIKTVEDYKNIVKNEIETEILEEMYLDDEDLSLLTGQGLDIPEDTYLEVSVDEAQPRNWFTKKIKKFIQKYIANKPRGKVKVWDTIKQEYVPVKGIEVISHQLGIFGNDWTDKNGNFSIPVAYTSLGYKVQMLLRYENPDVELISTDNATSLTGAVTYYVSMHWIEGLSDLDFRLSCKSQYGVYATVLNAEWDYVDFCNENGITKPMPLNIWVTESAGGACTTLCRYAAPEITAAVYDFIKVLLGIPAGSIESVLAPDVIIGTKDVTGTNLTEIVYSETFHELSHVSHYFGLGITGRSVWLSEYRDMISGWVETIDEGGDPFDNAYNNGGTDLVKLIESWGYFSENYIMQWKYAGFDIDYYAILENRELDFIEYPVLKSPSKPLFYYGGFYDLYDDKNENGIDYCTGYSYENMYNAITCSGVSDLNSFIEALCIVTENLTDFDNIKKTMENNHD